jgi:hypothetical protein
LTGFTGSLGFLSVEIYKGNIMLILLILSNCLRRCLRFQAGQGKSFDRIHGIGKINTR